RYLCYVGGLPQVRQWPYEYKAVFSPADVIEEYTRPARYVEHGEPVVRPALSDVELIDLPGVGTVEAFNTDGLRTLARTLDAPWMKEKTLRYPGHVNLMRALRESGFFSDEPLEIDGVAVRPLSLTSKLLFKQWKLAEGEADLTVMRVIVEGEKAGQSLRYTYDLLDRYDAATQTHSMARTTGYTCALVARQVIKGLFRQPGICPPEYVGRAPGCWADLLAGYAQRGIHLTETVETM
ncbi:MAG: saccharopine dehydrogenase, partial [Anaerolineae bacterium]|nr:saccharopine dehydrogenase [Anaerolineae bacterium]